jgi:hypothetical protein
MPATPTPLETSNDLTNLTAYSTGSQTPGANRLQLIAMKCRATTLRSVSTVTGCGLTWAKISDVTYNTVGTPLDRLELWYALGASPSTGALTITWSGAVSQCFWTWVEVDGVPITSGGADAYVAANVKTTNGDAVTGLMATLDALSSGTNIALGFFGFSDRTQAIDPEAGWTELGETQGTGTAADSGALSSQWDDGSDLTCEASWALSADAGMIALEIVSAGAAPSSPMFRGS